ncbi:MAG TPA: hypothetical protein PLP17_07485, partial [Oligoflexia bacterium]|nr:hypothetical protein [Oligoflexia bacterium]
VVIADQIANINRFLPGSLIVLHLAAGGFLYRRDVMDLCNQYPNVVLNPVGLPTAWGWMFHVHLSNYYFVRASGENFDYFMLEASNSMFFRHGAADYIAQYDALCEATPRVLGQEKWWVTQHAAKDECFLKMMRDLGIKHPCKSSHEGTVFRREVFEEMFQVFRRYYIFSFSEDRYAREEIYLGTVVGMFAKNLGSRLTFRDMKLTMERLKQLVVEPEGFFAVKPIPRIISDPKRLFINSLP